MQKEKLELSFNWRSFFDSYNHKLNRANFTTEASYMLAGRENYSWDAFC